jgi:hypothetical protein
VRSLSPRARAALGAYVAGLSAAYDAGSVLLDAEAELAPGTVAVERTQAGERLPARTFDLVVSVDAPHRCVDWGARLRQLRGVAARALVVVVENDERLGQAGAVSHDVLARLLWQLGRVREHVYVDCPRIASREAVVSVPAGRLVRATARLRAYVVDTGPRTPQARRRLRVAGREGEG